MKKSTLFKLAMMGIAASSSSTSLEGSDISNTSNNSALLAAGCGGSSSVRQGSGCNASARPSNPGYYTEAQANGGSHSCGSRGSSPSNGTVASHGCSSPNGCSNQATPTNAPSSKVAAPTAQPVSPSSNQQASSGSRYQYEKTANAPVAPALSEQDKIKQAAEKAKLEATKNAAQQAPTNAPNNNMMPKSLTPGNTGSSTGTGSGSYSK